MDAAVVIQVEINQPGACAMCFVSRMFHRANDNIMKKERQVEIIGYDPSWDDRIASLFRSTIRTSCSNDYTGSEIEAWISSSYSSGFSDKWGRSLTLLAVEGRHLLGFGNIDGDYLDCLYVEHSCQGQGVGRSILDALEPHGTFPLHVYASITARPFFIASGYQVVRENIVERNGERLRNYLMRKDHP